MKKGGRVKGKGIGENRIGMVAKLYRLFFEACVSWDFLKCSMILI